MKKATEVKFPNSVNLFQFCRRVLDHKFGGIRVIDQDVGQILGFDPADCSHWKKGKKNIRSIQAMKAIAEHLGVDERIVVELASGEIDELEAYAEWSNYSIFELDQRVIENAKKDYYRKNASTWTREREAEFKTHFDLQVPRIETIVNEIHTNINFAEAPLYLPEVVSHYADIKLLAVDDGVDSVSAETTDGVTTIRYPAGRDSRPYVRFQIAREIGKHFFIKLGFQTPKEIDEHGKHLSDIRANIFASLLLCPAKLIRQEMQNVNVGKDIVSQLAETFWVSKNFMNSRLKDLIQNDRLSA